MDTKISTRSTHTIESMIGREFGELTVVSFAYIKNGVRHYLCKCDCGGDRICAGAELRRHKVVRCMACYKAKKQLKKESYTNRSKYSFGHRLYADWNVVRRQCIDPMHHGYQYYGALGVKLCDRWRSFENFCQDMGEEKPFNTYLTRIDTTKEFCKENCKWARLEETERYMRRNEKARKQYHERKEKKKLDDFFE